MKRLVAIRRGDWMLIIIASALAVLWISIAASLYLDYRATHQQSHDLVPRIARLHGLAESQPLLERVSNEALQQWQGLVYGAQGDAESQLQQSVRTALQKAGITVAGSQILAAKKDQQFMRLSLDITASGDLESLEQALEALLVLKPLVSIDMLTIQPQVQRTRRADPAQLIGVRIRLSALQESL